MAKENDFTAMGEGWIGPLPEILTVQECAQYLREGVAAMRKMLREREETGDWKRTFRRGNLYKIPKQDVLDFIEKNYGEIK